MKKYSKHHVKRQLRFFFYRWHWRIGVLSALIFIVVALSGFLLNHPKLFSLDSTYPQSSWLLIPYKSSLSAPKGVEHHGNWFYVKNNQLYSNSKKMGHCRALITVRWLTSTGLIACQDDWYVLDEQLSVIDVISVYDLELPSFKYQFTEVNHQLAIIIDASKSLYLVDIQNGLINAIANSSAYEPITKMQSLPTQYDTHNNSISWQRVWLDIHSGRWLSPWLGNAGVWIIDIAALFLILLSLSGFWLWASRHRRKSKTNR
jgi:hypothetical protein